MQVSFPPAAVRRVGARAADQVVVGGIVPEDVVASGTEQSVVDGAVPLSVSSRSEPTYSSMNPKVIVLAHGGAGGRSQGAPCDHYRDTDEPASVRRSRSHRCASCPGTR